MKEGSGANEEARFVVKSLEMVVTEGGKNFSTGQSSSPFRPPFLLSLSLLPSLPLLPFPPAF